MGDNGVSCLGADRISLSQVLSKCLSNVKYFYNPVYKSYNHCYIPPNRWIGGKERKYNSGKIDLIDVIRQTSDHFRTSGIPRLESAKGLDQCVKTHWDRWFHEDDYCQVSSRGEATLTLSEVIRDSADAAAAI